MPRERSVVKIVQQFKRMTDEERYRALSDIMRGDAESTELAWRAKLCTALERGKVYPKEKYEDSSD